MPTFSIAQTRLHWSSDLQSARRSTPRSFRIACHETSDRIGFGGADGWFASQVAAADLELDTGVWKKSLPPWLRQDVRADLYHIAVECDIVVPRFRDAVFLENGLSWAFGNAGTTFDALIGVNEQHRFPFVKAVAGADDDALGVFAAKAGFRDNHCHGSVPSRGPDRDLRK